MEILIDDYRYHLNNLNEDEFSYLKEIKKKLYVLYPVLNKITFESFNKYNDKYCDNERDVIIDKLILGIVKSIKDKYKDSLQEQQFYSYLKKDYIKALPILLKLDKRISLDRYFLYEPIVLYSMYLNIKLYNKLIEITNNNKLDDQTYVLFCSLINILRSSKSSLLLFIMGDDVHGYALYRGIIEQLSRIILSSLFTEEYTLFIYLNSLIQKEKEGKDLSSSEKKIVDTFLKENKLTRKSCENFLLYGWIKNKNGKRINTATEMIEIAYEGQASEALKLYHKASEFIHEDYIGVSYDYIQMRKESKVEIPSYIVFVYQFVKELSLSKTDKLVYSYLKEKDNYEELEKMFQE